MNIGEDIVRIQLYAYESWLLYSGYTKVASLGFYVVYLYFILTINELLFYFGFQQINIPNS
jgi:hypothetical protein